MSDIHNMISASVDQKPIDFSNAFNNMMLDKIQVAINNKKIEIAKSMYNYDSNHKSVDLEANAEE